MTVRVAINGFGRIGRNIVRAIFESGRKDIDVVAVNDLGPVETNAHLLRYDSVHGRFPHEVTVDGDSISIGKEKFKVLAVKDPSTLPWKELGVDIALECTGIFTARDKAAAHLTAGAKRVIVSAPADGADLTVVYGINHDKLTKDHIVISNALLHDELPRAAGRRAARDRRHREGHDDDDPLLHRRPADARHDAQGSLPRPRRGTFADPDLDGCGQGDRPRAAGTQGQARRHLDPRADPERLGGRPEVRRQALDDVEEINDARDRRLEAASSRACSPSPTTRTSRSDFNHDPHSSTMALDQTKVMDGNFVFGAVLVRQ